MSFGHVSGPSASAKQVSELLALVQRAGYTGFREARHPLGFTQRQAAGKFTRDEAEGLIEQLEVAPHAPAPDADADEGDRPAVATAPRSPARRSTAADAVRRLPDELLAAELRRRGWSVDEPRR